MIFLATENQGKINEISALFNNADLPNHLKSLQDLPDKIKSEYNPVENGKNFHENAAIKAKALFKLIHEPVIAEDSGLIVEALDGKPGIHSARYETTDNKRINKLLTEMKNINNRRATFIAVISIMISENDIIFFRGRIDGAISESPKGTNGFGYDPVFIPNQLSQSKKSEKKSTQPDKTFAEMTTSQKSFLSHRSRAFTLAIQFLKNQKDLRI